MLIVCMILIKKQIKKNEIDNVLIDKKIEMWKKQDKMPKGRRLDRPKLFLSNTFFII